MNCFLCLYLMPVNKQHIKELIPLVASAAVYISGLILEDRLAGTLYSIPYYLLFLSVWLYSGYGVLYKAVKKTFSGDFFDENFLMTLATTGAIAIGQLPEAAGVMIFYQTGEFLQSLSVRRSRNSIRALLQVRPDYANLYSEGSFVRVSPEEVRPGSLILVKPGEKIPLDGIVEDGTALVDTSPLTGESLPRKLSKGQEALAGCISKDGQLSIRVTRPFGNSSVARILELVESATARKAQTEKFITRFSKFYTPFVVLAALLTALLPPLIYPGASFSDWLYRALVILVISCPCALVISIPLGYFGGIGASSRKGILVKGSNFLDVLTKVDTVIFDKTGTLTKGVFRVTGIFPKNGYSENQLLECAASAELHSNHPIAQAVRQSYPQNIPHAEVIGTQETAGMGVKAVYKNRIVMAGNGKLMDSEGIGYDDCNLHKTAVYVAVDREYAGCIVISDEIKDDASHAVASLRQRGVRHVYMMTGDNARTASEISDELGLDGYFAGLMPEDKVEVMEQIMQQSKGSVAFIGDGINDAPVIARSDVGFAMGALGSDAAIETADIVLMTDQPSKVAQAIAIARKTHAIVWQNIIFAMGIKFLFISLGAFGLAGMWEAVFADMGVALAAILNSTRVLSYKSRLVN